MTERPEWMPTMQGNTTAYVPEYREGAWDDGEMHWTKWKTIPTVDVLGGAGVPYPAFMGGMFQVMGMFGYEQANAFAWSFAAHAKSRRANEVETRVVTYEFRYDLKAKRLDPPQPQIDRERK